MSENVPFCHSPNIKRLAILFSLAAVSVLMCTLEIIGLTGVSRRKIILMMAREHDRLPLSENGVSIEKSNNSSSQFITQLYLSALPPDVREEATANISEIEEFLKFTSEVALTSRDKDIFSFLLKTFDTICKKANVSYFMYSGSLLGVYRVNDILLWDDDVDVALHAKDARLFAEHVTNESVSNNLSISAYLKSQHLIKFYSPQLSYLDIPGPYFGNYEWKWPFIDVFLYYDEFLSPKDTESPSFEEIDDIFKNGTFPNNTRIAFSEEYQLNKSVVFPLSTATFMNQTVSVPAKVRESLLEMLGLDVFKICQTNHYDHRKEEERIPLGKKIRVKCKWIKHILYPNTSFNLELESKRT